MPDTAYVKYTIGDILENFKQPQVANKMDEFYAGLKAKNS